MQNKKSIIVMACVILFSKLARAESDLKSEKETHIIKISETPQEIFVPPKLWDLLDGQSQADHGSHSPPTQGHGSENEEGGGGESKTKDGGFDLMNDSQIFLFSRVNVHLKAKNEGVLREMNYQIQFPKGGGQLDFSPLVGPLKGTFFLTFELPDWPETNELKVFFLSRSRKRKINGEIFGAGCNKIINITSLVTQSEKKGGIKVNTTNDRHLAVLGGSFFFVAKKNKETFLSQVTITDSSQKKLFCQEN